MKVKSESEVAQSLMPKKLSQTQGCIITQKCHYGPDSLQSLTFAEVCA